MSSITNLKMYSRKSKDSFYDEKIESLEELYDLNKFDNINKKVKKSEKINLNQFKNITSVANDIKNSLIDESRYVRNIEVIESAKTRAEKIDQSKEQNDRKYYNQLSAYFFSENLIPYYKRNINTGTPFGIAAVNQNSVYFTMINKNDARKGYYVKTNFGMKGLTLDELNKVLEPIEQQNNYARVGKAPYVHFY